MNLLTEDQQKLIENIKKRYLDGQSRYSINEVGTLLDIIELQGKALDKAVENLWNPERDETIKQIQKIMNGAGEC